MDARDQEHDPLTTEVMYDEMRRQITREFKLKALLAESQEKVKEQERQIEELQLHFEGMMKVTSSEGALWTGAWLHAAATAAEAAWDDGIADGTNTSAHRTRHQSELDKACAGQEKLRMSVLMEQQAKSARALQAAAEAGGLKELIQHRQRERAREKISAARGSLLRNSRRSGRAAEDGTGASAERHPRAAGGDQQGSADGHRRDGEGRRGGGERGRGGERKKGPGRGGRDKAARSVERERGRRGGRAGAREGDREEIGALGARGEVTAGLYGDGGGGDGVEPQEGFAMGGTTALANMCGFPLADEELKGAPKEPYKELLAKEPSSTLN